MTPKPVFVLEFVFDQGLSMERNQNLGSQGIYVLIISFSFSFSGRRLRNLYCLRKLTVQLRITDILTPTPPQFCDYSASHLLRFLEVLI